MHDAKLSNKVYIYNNLLYVAHQTIIMFLYSMTKIRYGILFYYVRNKIDIISFGLSIFEAHTKMYPRLNVGQQNFGPKSPWNMGPLERLIAKLTVTKQKPIIALKKKINK